MTREELRRIVRDATVSVEHGRITDFSWSVFNQVTMALESAWSEMDRLKVDLLEARKTSSDKRQKEKGAVA